jgi:hypothetical protein
MSRQGPVVCFCEHGDESQVFNLSERCNIRRQLHKLAPVSSVLTYWLYSCRPRKISTQLYLFTRYTGQQCGAASSTTINILSHVRYTYSHFPVTRRQLSTLSETKCNPNYISIFISYRAVNILRLGYINQSVYVLK